jgi:cobalt-zinc-cadmium efflux system protein
MEHGHAHHSPALTHVNRAFIVGIGLNLLFVLIEVVFGFYAHSLSLLSDAGHNLADVATLALALLAFRLLKIRSNKYFTYGYRKTSILVALFNALVLVASVGIIIYEAILRFFHPQPTPGATIAIVAGIGMLINGITAFMFLKNKERDINIKSAYLHLLSDALVSFAIVLGGLMIHFTGWFWIDSLLSCLVALVILYSTWGILKDSLRLSLDGVPAGIDLAEIKSHLLSIEGVKNVHDLHIWGISSTENALTAHLVLREGISPEEEYQIKQKLKHDLLHDNIHHATLETERENELCNIPSCENN